MTKQGVTKKYLSEFSAEDVERKIVANVFVVGESAKKALPKQLFINCDKRLFFLCCDA